MADAASITRSAIVDNRGESALEWRPYAIPGWNRHIKAGVGSSIPLAACDQDMTYKDGVTKFEEAKTFKVLGADNVSFGDVHPPKLP